jgi:hypothetical protein
MTDRPPKIENAPGLTRALRKLGWEARWRARKDIVRNGYPTKSVPLWRGWELDGAATAYICSMCRKLQDEMLEWGAGGSLLKFTPGFDGTWGSMIDCYRTNEYSTYQGLRYHTRLGYDKVLDQLKINHGSESLAEANAMVFLQWHRAAKGEKNRVASAHSLMTMIRTVIGFGATIFEEAQCKRLREILSGMKFEMVGHRTERITPDQAVALCDTAHAMGFHSIALAQALAFECTFRQKDVIGEYVPASEPGIFDAKELYGHERWHRGLRWEEIDENFILRHVTSKKLKAIEVNLHLAPMVMDELAFLARVDPAKGVSRSELPKAGPVVICERTGAPFAAYHFRITWRRIAKRAGIPANVYNMDSRAGAISEGLLAGAPMDHVRQSAAHSDIAQTQKYDRAQAEATSNVMRMRVGSRNKGGTTGGQNA